ncbi:MAG TPA: flagellar hook capping FlgD N-terminal domain-containing protein [Candidatus Polarisedimenticolia bacterium]|nr:flagellar hook capping FlgD N-terminal domain-containing protein [Candidatus Polarisedimenticolia bacterium]
MDATFPDPVLSAAQAAQEAQVASSTKSPHALGKDEFLKLLVAQLEHQDPLTPKADTEFVAQLATFSSLEQLMTANTNLTSIAAGQGSLLDAQALGLIGKEALVAGGDAVHVRQGKPDLIMYALPGPAREATLTLYGKDGAPVRTFRLDPGADGRVLLPWDGTDESGKPLADGDYRIEASATGASGEKLNVSLFRSLTIDAVDFGGEGISLVSGGQAIPFGSIVEIRAGH